MLNAAAVDRWVINRLPVGSHYGNFSGSWLHDYLAATSAEEAKLCGGGGLPINLHAQIIEGTLSLSGQGDFIWQK